MSRRVPVLVLTALFVLGGAGVAPGTARPALAGQSAIRAKPGRPPKPKPGASRPWWKLGFDRRKAPIDGTTLAVKPSTRLKLDPGNGQRMRDRIRNWPKGKDFVILSLDGGGIRGVLTAKLLERIEKQRPGFLDRVDAVAGTSTGAIVGSAIAAGMQPSEIVEFFKQRGPGIFRRTHARKLRTLFAMLGAKYDVADLEAGFADYFGDATLDHLQKAVLIPTFELDTGGGKGATPYFFKNLDRPDSTKVTEVLRATTAAPTYFSTAGKYIDGGVVANNPVLSAIAEALAAGIPDEQIKVLSIGTGRNPKLFQGGDKGMVNWGIDLANIMLDAPTQATEYQARAIYGRQYYRINPILSEEVPMDDAGQIDSLIRIGRKAKLKDPSMGAWAKKLRTNLRAGDEAEAARLKRDQADVFRWIDQIKH